MKYQRDIYNFTDLAESFFVQNRSSYIEAMCCSDSNRQGSNTCTFHKFFRFLRICVGICFCFQIVFFTANFTKFCLTWDVQRVGYICYSFCFCDISFKVKFGTVDHYRSVSCMNRLHSQLKAAAMIQVKAYRNGCFCSFCCNDSSVSLHCSVFNSGWCSLDHNRCFQFFSCLDDCFHHFHIFCIECAYCVSTFLSF